jgi:hypothetical protein
MANVSVILPVKAGRIYPMGSTKARVSNRGIPAAIFIIPVTVFWKPDKMLVAEP